MPDVVMFSRTLAALQIEPAERLLVHQQHLARGSETIGYGVAISLDAVPSRHVCGLDYLHRLPVADAQLNRDDGTMRLTVHNILLSLDPALIVHVSDGGWRQRGSR